MPFVAGQPYKLVLDNPKPEKHYFIFYRQRFSDGIWTRKVLI